MRTGGATALFFTLLSDTGPGHSLTTEVLAGAYLWYSLLVLVVSRSRAEWLVRHVNAVHVVDFLWITVASTVGGGTGSHSFSLFAFVLAAAAFRWGLERAFVNALLVLGVGILQDAAAATALTPWAYESDHFLLQVSYITSGMAVLFGVLADRLHCTRQQAATITTLVSNITRATFIREALSTTLAGIHRAMGAASVVVVAEDTYTGAITVWQTEAGPDDVVVTDEDVPRDRSGDWLAPAAPRLCACEFRRRHAADDAVITICLHRREAEGTCNSAIVPGVRRLPGWRKLHVVPFTAPGAWRGHIYVLDATSRPRGELALRFLGDIIRQVTPPLLNLYLLRRLRWRAESAERSRISRALHDTANQSLAAIGMRLDLLMREGSDRGCAMTTELLELRDLVRGVDLDLRESVSQPPQDVDAERLPFVLNEIVTRFSRQSGIEGRLDWTLKELSLPPQHCVEVARIVQEALFNVRRHSKATRTSVRFAPAESGCGWQLVIDDNGRGLGFTGRLSGDDPQLQVKAPRVIRERTQALRGSIAVESSAGGTRLELTFPHHK